MMELLVNFLSLSPQGFAPGAYNLSLTVGTALAPWAVYIMILLWGIDFFGSAINMSDKPLQTFAKHLIFLGLGIVFTHVSFFLVMGLFQVFGNLLGGFVNIDTLIAAPIEDFRDNTLTIVEGLNATQNMVFFVFLLFSALSFIGMLLGMLLVPIAIFIELYVYAAFSPIPIATLFTGQKQVGIAFLKLVISVCLRGPLVIFGMSIAAQILAANLFNVADLYIFEPFTYGSISISWLDGFWGFLVPIFTITIALMVLQKSIKGAEQFARALTGAQQ